MKTYALRLKPGDDLVDELKKFVFEKDIKAGCILTCVGSLERTTIRLRNEDQIENIEETTEILSLVGTLSKDGVHLHICVSDQNGIAVGGHAKKGCIIYTTAEIIVADLDQYKFSRKMDNETGYKELVIS